MATPERIVDLRKELPGARHQLIFDIFASLAPGAALVLVHSREPKPLYYKFTKRYPNEFSWDYLEEGPEAWRVRIVRRVAA